MKFFNKEIGSYGEELAAVYLKSCGYKIEERNYRCKLGEIDIIAIKNNYICFIEVKSRYDEKFGAPVFAVTHKKQVKLLQLAQIYICHKKFFNCFYRFDIVEVFFNRLDSGYKINLIENAFGE